MNNGLFKRDQGLMHFKCCSHAHWPTHRHHELLPLFAFAEPEYKTQAAPNAFLFIALQSSIVYENYHDLPTPQFWTLRSISDSISSHLLS